MLRAGIFLPAGVNVSPEPCFVDDYKDIQSHVGGAFDVVTTDLDTFAEADFQDEPSLRAQFVGFVSDTGAIDGSELNYLATALFRRPIHGGAVVLWGLNADYETDGESYDLPDSAVKFLLEDLVYVTAENYNDSVIMDAVLKVCIEVGHISKDYAVGLSQRLCSHAVTGDLRKLLETETELLAILDWSVRNLEVPQEVKDAIQRVSETLKSHREEWGQ